MFLVGLTGGIGTGKSTVSKAFQKCNCAVIDADVIARQVVLPGKPAWRKIKAFFGDEILREDGTINRELLGQIVFSDSQKRAVLNSFTHPEIYKAMLLKIAFFFFRGYQFVILDLPLLFETRKMVPLLSYTVVVSCVAFIFGLQLALLAADEFGRCTDYQQRQRVQRRDGLTPEEVDHRILSQMSMTEKCRLANCVIDNSGTEEMTEAQVFVLVKKFRQSRAHWPVRIVVCLILFGIFTAVKHIWF